MLDEINKMVGEYRHLGDSIVCTCLRFLDVLIAFVVFPQRSGLFLFQSTSNCLCTGQLVVTSFVFIVYRSSQLSYVRCMEIISCLFYIFVCPITKDRSLPSNED